MAGTSSKSRKSKVVLPTRSKSQLQEQSTSSYTANATGCCGRVRSEWRHPAFSSTEVTGEIINGPATFAPSGRWSVILKTITMSWSVAVLVSGLLDAAPPKAFYFAYLTHCTLVSASIYFIVSWWNTFYATVFQRSTPNTNGTTWIHNTAWALFAIAAPGQIVVTVGYWGSGCSWEGANLESAMEYRNIMEHGGVMSLVLFEGLIVNRIPLRLRHSVVLVVYLAMYLIWTFLHAYLDIGDPTSNDDDSIYGDALQWRNDPWTTAGVALAILLFLAPLSFFIVYGLSLSCGCCFRRRYVGSESHDAMSYIEMGSSSSSSSSSNRRNKISVQRQQGIV